MRAARMLFLFVVLLSPKLSAESLYRCTGPGGETLYTDRLCRGGEEFEPAAPNVVSSEDSAYHYERTPDPVEPRRRSGSSRRITDCDNAAELRHIDLMIKSLRADKRQQQFLKAERRRVARCEHENLSAEERQRRDAALRRTGSLRGSQRTEAEGEIEGLYGGKPSNGKRKKR